MTIMSASRPATEHFMTTWDGSELFYRVWQPAVPTNKALLLFHRGHEHSGRFQDVVDELGLEDVAVIAWDARGHGQSPGERGYADNFACVVKDIDVFVRHIAKEHSIPLENIVVLGHSVGAVAVCAWVHDYAPPIRALILATPAFRVKLYVPFAIPGLRTWQTIKGKAFIKSYVKANMLTHDREQAEQYQADPLISRNIAVNILLDLFDTSTRLMDDAGAIRVPTLVLAAGSDWVVKLSAQRRFFERLGSDSKEMVVYPGFFHALLHEKDRHLPIAKTREFVIRSFETSLERRPLLDAHKQGYTKAEYDRLVQPLPAWRPKRWGFAFIRLLMKTFGRWSAGIDIGWRTGFDSGQSLDYIYANQAQGRFGLGRLIDRMYLNSVGWKGIRQRKLNLEKVLQATIEKVHSEGKPVHVVDIASGPGRYLLDTLKKIPHIPVSAVLRDRSDEGLEAGRKLAREMNFSNDLASGVASAPRVNYIKGDAFDPKSLAEINPRPTIAVVSGLYELFPDNELISASLRGLAAVLPEGGYLIYTNQPWHPQVEFIARVLINRDGQPWVMRRRSQAEMDDLVHAAGFEKLDMEIDAYGIFTVSLAWKKG
jgi:alpha-beta hydrolase superfamily lysophospholipase/SAM-dependent methyltransferase